MAKNKKKLTTLNVAKYVGQLEYSYTPGGSIKQHLKKRNKTVWQFLKSEIYSCHMIQLLHFWVFTQEERKKTCTETWTQMCKAPLFLIAPSR